MRRERTGDQEQPLVWAHLCRPGVAVLIFSLLAVVIYANSLGNGFVFDDIGIVVSNKDVRTFDHLPRLFASGGWRTYRPLRTISYAIDYRLFGLNPGGFRGFNIFYHAVNGALLFVIVRRLVGQARPALLAAILFIVHPIQTDSVAYISGRRDLLFTLFYLIGFYLFIRYRETSKIRYLCLAGGSYYLSLLSKEMAVTLPLLCLGYDLTGSLPTTSSKSRTPWQLLRDGTRDLFARHKWFYLAMGAAFALVASYYMFFFRVSRQREMWGEGLWPTLLTSARIFAHYLKLLVFPVTLNADYSYNAFPLSYSLVDVRVILALIILGGAWWGIYRLLAVDRWAAFGGLWFFVTLLPVSQIIPHHELMAEHYLYLPSAGVFLAAALLFDRQLSRSHRVPALSAAFALLVLLLAARTVVRNRDWRDNLTLWTKTVQTAPQSARAHTNLGEALMRRGLFSQAEGEFREALRIMPNDAVNLDNHGLSLLRLGRVDEAERDFREALRILPIPKSQIHLGLVHLKRGRVDEAEQQFRTGLNSSGLAPAMRTMALNNLGIASAIKGRREEAELAFKEAIRLDQKYAEARGNLGRLYLETRRYREAATELEEAIRLKRSDANFHRLLGEAYYQQGKKELAAVELAKALSLKTDLPDARALLNKISRERASERGKRG